MLKRVRMIQTLATPNGVLKRHEEYELPEHQAIELVQRRLADERPDAEVKDQPPPYTLSRSGGRSPALSILIPTIPDRQAFLDRLRDILDPQITERVEIVALWDNGERSIGRKRNELLDAASGRYVAFVDDDDLVAADYVERILKALDTSPAPDCVGFKVARVVDGREEGEAIHSLRYDVWGDAVVNGRHEYQRTPNHLNPVRRNLALKVRFRDINHGEDRDYSERLRPLLANEAFLSGEPVYRYEYRRPQTRNETTNQHRRDAAEKDRRTARRGHNAICGATE